MEEKFLFGIVIGMLGGALIATHSAKTRQIVKEGESQIKNKVSKIADKSSKK